MLIYHDIEPTHQAYEIVKSSDSSLAHPTTVWDGSILSALIEGRLKRFNEETK